MEVATRSLLNHAREGCPVAPYSIFHICSAAGWSGSWCVSLDRASFAPLPLTSIFCRMLVGPESGLFSWMGQCSLPAVDLHNLALWQNLHRVLNLCQKHKQVPLFLLLLKVLDHFCLHSRTSTVSPICYRTQSRSRAMPSIVNLVLFDVEPECDSRA